jgi:phosphohistidine phosphatase SixA
MTPTALVLASVLAAAQGAAATTATPAPKAAAGVKLVVLVRHAEKGDDPQDPGLSPAGKARAEVLATSFERYKIGHVFTSDTKRARETAAPFAKAHGLTPVEVTVANGPDAHASAVAAAIQALPAGSASLVIGHSNTLALVIDALGGPKVPPLCEKQYSVLYVLTMPGSEIPRLSTETYGAPDPPDPCR